jgi:hypothetical protein
MNTVWLVTTEEVNTIGHRGCHVSRKTNYDVEDTKPSRLPRPEYGRELVSQEDRWMMGQLITCCDKRGDRRH